MMIERLSISCRDTDSYKLQNIESGGVNEIVKLLNQYKKDIY